VEVAQHTRRENVVSLTPAGRELVQRGDVAFERAREGLPGIDAADLAATLRVLGAFNAAMDDVARERAR
jgi:DNA-binding MarR family transcriptional regulator